jgi:hypothetical protein
MSGNRQSSTAPGTAGVIHWKQSFRSVEIVISGGCTESSEPCLLLDEETQMCARSQMSLEIGKTSHEEAMVAVVEGAEVEMPPWWRFPER